MPTDDYANSPNMSRSEEIIQSILDGTEYDEPARSRIEYLLKELKAAIEGGGGGGGSYTAGDGLSISGNTISVIPATAETIGGIIIGDGLEVDEEGVLSSPGSVKYIPGDGITIDSGSFELSAKTVENTQYFFNTNVASEIGGRIYTKYNIEPALAAIVYSSAGYTQPYFVGLTADSVKYGTNYDSHIWPNPNHASFEYKGITWYYSGFEYAMSGDGTDSLGHMVKLPGSYSVTTEADLQNIARAIIDAADIIIGSKTISVKLGEGLSFDANDAIKVDGLSELQAKTVGMSEGGSNYIVVGGIRVYVSSTAPTGDIPDGSIWIGG